jgi:DNA (cytosine-5)-methyltransferase 1
MTHIRADLESVLVADLFCGAGGSSTGAERALRQMGRRMVLTCVNHWPVAIETHQLNHPDARHYCMDLEAAKPEDLVPEGRLDLLMASPTCTYHSNARGGRPTSDQQRMDPWHVVRWCTTLRVDRLLVENVPEFANWGPVDPRTGRPIKARRGEYFRAWVAALQAIGFDIDWRIVNAADYGDATTRRRFFLIGRSDGVLAAACWPAPSHAPADRAEMLGLAPWRPAREILDWSIQGQSIFERKRPLAANTLRRIAAGLARHGGDFATPFLVILRNHCDALGIDVPLPSITAKGTHIGLAQPELRPFVLGQQSCAAARQVGDPLPTISTAGAISLIEPILVQTDQTGGRGSYTRTVQDPIPTVVTKRNLALAEPFLAPYYGSGSGQTGKSVSEPMDTVTAKARFSLIEPIVAAAGTVDCDRMVIVNGKPHLLDIRFRMIKNHELARATGFSDAEAEYEFVGNQTEITKQIGNAVPVGTSTALVRALFRERRAA